jgi:hypothetical protein
VGTISAHPHGLGHDGAIEIQGQGWRSQGRVEKIGFCCQMRRAEPGVTGAFWDRGMALSSLWDLVVFLASLARNYVRGYIMPPLRGWVCV